MYVKEKKHFQQHNDILNSYVPYGFGTNTFPQEKYISLNMEGIKNEKIIILVKVRDVMYLPNFSFFTEMGNVIQQLDNNITWEEYVV